MVIVLVTLLFCKKYIGLIMTKVVLKITEIYELVMRKEATKLNLDNNKGV